MSPAADAPDDLGGFALFDLFRMEAESHGATLDEGLLALESAPTDPARLEGLMRAAHSIKGAARIVGIDAVVRVAHAMEDAFVAAQKGRLVLGAAAIDVLLAGTDLLKSVASKDEATATAYLAGRAEETDALVAKLQAVARGEAPTAPAVEHPPSAPAAVPAAPPAPVAAPAAPAVVPPPPPAVTPPASAAAPAAPPARKATPQEAADASVVRISASGLGHMLAYAGETLVEARRLGVAAAEFEDLRRVTRRLQAEVEEFAAETSAPVAALRETVLAARRAVMHQIEVIEGAARRSEDLAGRLYREVLASRMRPFGEATGGFPRLVRDLSRELGKRVRLELLGKDVLVDRDVLEKLDAPLNHLLRNALDHGVETPEVRAAAGKPPEARILLEARHRAGMLEVEVSDDGRGIEYESLRAKIVERGLISPEIAKDLSKAELLEFLFLPGFSTKAVVTQISGRGVGLDVVQTSARELGGTVAASSDTGRGLRFVMTLPITRSVVRAALAEIAGEPYAFPLTRIERVLRVEAKDIRAVEGREQFAWEGRSVGLLPAAQVLGLPPPPRAEGPVPVILIASADHLLRPRRGPLPRRAGPRRSTARPAAWQGRERRGRVGRRGRQPRHDRGRRGPPALGRPLAPPGAHARDPRHGRHGRAGRARAQAGARGRRLDHGARGRARAADGARLRRRRGRRRHGRLERGAGRNVRARGHRRRHAAHGRHRARAPHQAGRAPEVDPRDDRVVQGPRGGSSARPRGGRRRLPDEELVPGGELDRTRRRPDRRAAGGARVRVAIVNDLRIATEALRRLLASQPDCELAWTALDGAAAVEACRADVPDLILMDLVMPVMDGVEATRRIMQATPCPILVVTATVDGRLDMVYKALGAGALDAVNCPTFGTDGRLEGGEPVLRKIRILKRMRAPSANPATPAIPAAPLKAPAPQTPRTSAPTPVSGTSYVLLGSSTGGPEALSVVLRGLSKDFSAPILVVQHLDPAFVPGLVEWLARETGRRVRAIVAGDRPAAETVLVACTADHLVFARDGSLRYQVEPVDEPYRPSVDVFFESAVTPVIAPGVAVVLTGMGRDGADGLLSLRQAGWRTFAQDAATSVVYGMPRAAKESGGAQQIVALPQMGASVESAWRALASAKERAST